MKKLCTKCHFEKPFEKFNAFKHGKFGLHSWCKVCTQVYSKNYRMKFPEKVRLQKSTSYQKNKSYYIKYTSGHSKRMLCTDLNWRLRGTLRARLNKALERGTKTGSAVRDLGCSIAEFRKYLESKFQPGMTWDNWSRTGWHIDHIRPLASFDLTDREQLKQAVHYTNLQPLWAKDNQIKAYKGV